MRPSKPAMQASLYMRHRMRAAGQHLAKVILREFVRLSLRTYSGPAGRGPRTSLLAVGRPAVRKAVGGSRQWAHTCVLRPIRRVPGNDTRFARATFMRAGRVRPTRPLALLPGPPRPCCLQLCGAVRCTGFEPVQIGAGLPPTFSLRPAP